MTLREAKRLQPGDEVYWNDPDETCSRYVTIRYIRINGDIISIDTQDGSEIECFAHELS